MYGIFIFKDFEGFDDPNKNSILVKCDDYVEYEAISSKLLDAGAVLIVASDKALVEERGRNGGIKERKEE